MIGTTLGHFQIERKLGAGGMGEVYRARDTKLGRDVALKLLPQTTPEKLARFEREARAVAGLAHPNIVVLYAIEQYEGQHFLVLELVEGQDLSELVSPGGLPLARVLELAIPLADALASAHERGVVHRDLKPANVKLARDGRVKVLDFGLARMLESDTAQTMEAPLSGAGQVMGTVPYMAPEQLRGEAVDARADLFALGVILYELATGRRPFGGKAAADISSAILRDDPAPAKELSPELARLIDRCLTKNPRERVQTAIDIASELRRIAAGRPPSAKRPEGEVSIAVLPFANRSASADDEYFADGLADELLGVLARIRGLRVAARTSSGRFKGTTEKLSAIGEQLNVETLLEGSVRKAGNRVRIGVQLVRVADGDAVWSQTYDRTLDDVFAVQDDIAHSVVKELRKALLGEADDSDASREARAEVAQAAAKGRSSNPEVQRLLLLARHFHERRTKADLKSAIQYLEQALALDPAFATAWADLGRTHNSLFRLGYDEDGAHAEAAGKAVARALELDPKLGEAHSLRCWMRLQELDIKGAVAALREAERCEPEQFFVLVAAAAVASVEGRSEDAIAIYQKLVERDPLNTVPYINLSLEYGTVGRDEDSAETLRKALELAPGSTTARSQYAVVLARLGRFEEALATVEPDASEPFVLWARAIALSAAGRRAESDSELEQLITGYADYAPTQIAGVYAFRGEIDLAFSWLDKAREVKDGGLFEIRSGPEYRSLHGDPRWTDLLRWLGLEP